MHGADARLGERSQAEAAGNLTVREQRKVFTAAMLTLLAEFAAYLERDPVED